MIGCREGDDMVVVDGGGPKSDSSTCRMTSASLRSSDSTGDDSSMRSAFIRPKALVLGSMLVLLDTGRRITPGGLCDVPPSSPLSFPDEIFNSFVTCDMLSLREPGLLNTGFLAKYPSLVLKPGLVGTEGLGTPLCPLPLLDDCLL